MVITLTGANDFLRQAELAELIAGFVATHTDMAVERFDGEETTTARMHESLSSLPFLTTRKLVVLREPGKQKAWAERINEILKEVAETTDVVIVEPKLDKRLGYYKILKKQTDFREFGELDPGGLARWASDYTKGQGGSLGANEARFLLDRIGGNQQLLQQELDKLLTFDSTITRQAIELLTEPTPQSTIFELVDAAFSGNTKRALELYREQRAQKVEPQAILAMLAWQLHVLALVATAGSRTADDIARAAKLNPFVVRKSQNLARAIEPGQLKRNITKLLALDLKTKTTAIDPDEALRLYLLQIHAKALAL